MIRSRERVAEHLQVRSWWWWVSAVAIGVFFGNLVSYGAYQLYLEWEFRKMVVSFEQVITNQAEQSREAMEERAKQNAARIQRQRDSAATMTRLRKTCDYWTRVVRTENTSLNRGYKRMACARVRNFSN